MSWLYVLVFGLAIIGWLVLLGGIGFLGILSWRSRREGWSTSITVAVEEDRNNDATDTAIVPDPLPRRPQPYPWMSYGTRGARVHRYCAVNRQDACDTCAPIVGRPVTPRQQP